MNRLMTRALAFQVALVALLGVPMTALAGWSCSGGLATYTGTSSGTVIVFGCFTAGGTVAVCDGGTLSAPSGCSDTCSTLSFNYLVDGAGGADDIVLLKEGESYDCNSDPDDELILDGITDSQFSTKYVDAHGGTGGDDIWMPGGQSTDPGDTGDSQGLGQDGDDQVSVRVADSNSVGDGGLNNDQMCSPLAIGGERLYGGGGDDCLDVFFSGGLNPTDFDCDDTSESTGDDYDDDFVESCTDNAGFCRECENVVSSCTCLGSPPTSA